MSARGGGFDGSSSGNGTAPRPLNLPPASRGSAHDGFSLPRRPKRDSVVKANAVPSLPPAVDSGRWGGGVPQMPPSPRVRQGSANPRQHHLGDLLKSSEEKRSLVGGGARPQQEHQPTPSSLPTTHPATARQPKPPTQGKVLPHPPGGEGGGSRSARVGGGGGGLSDFNRPLPHAQEDTTGGGVLASSSNVGKPTTNPPDGSMGKLTPANALELYSSAMTQYERREILDYDEVYFVGVSCPKKIQAPVNDGHNFGYDDERGDYQYIMGDHVAFRYELISELGKGSFGQVVKAKDHKRSTFCALKIIRNKKRFHQQATVEIRILDHLRCRDPEERSCTLRMLNYFKFRSHTIITTELHNVNLYELTKLNNYQPFAPALIKRFTAQLLVALSFMWQEHVVHCDLKPENILLRHENKTSIKVIDFGSSCFDNERVYSYIQSRFYRAPEVILGVPYGRKIDMWSLGCVICEMQIGYPIFPGESEKEQMLCIMEVIGVPPERVVEKAPRKDNFFDPSGAPIITPNSRNKVRKPGTKDLQRVLATTDPDFVAFIKCFLQWDPDERFTPHEAMRHKWIRDCFKQDTVTASERRSEPKQLPAL